VDGEEAGAIVAGLAIGMDTAATMSLALAQGQDSAMFERVNLEVVMGLVGAIE